MMMKMKGGDLDASQEEGNSQPPQLGHGPLRQGINGEAEPEDP
jgi:hypothetical protein